MAPASAIAALSVYIFTFNCGLLAIDSDAVASQLFNALTTPQLPDLLVLSLQEIAPLPHALVGGSFLVPYFAKFHDAVEKASKKLGGEYTAVMARNVGMTALVVFAKDPAAVRDLETAGVGVGLWDMGNKGAVGVRFTYHRSDGETELTFVAAHLAAMEDEVERRNQDWKSIVRGLVFSSVSKSNGQATSLSVSSEDRPLLSISPRDASIYKPTSHLFVAGDLNYRTSSIKPSPTDYVDTFPQPHYDTTHNNHFSNLFEHDQLTQELEAGRTLHGLVEERITFPPTYKYNSKEPFLTPDEDLIQWHWAKHRWPSWCDRILYLPLPSWLSKPGAKIVAHKYTSVPLFPTSDHRAVALSLSLPLIPIPPPQEEEESDDPRVKPPFNVSPDWKQSRQRARILELFVGFTLYFTTTWEGAAVLVAGVAGIVGGYFVLRAFLNF
ncbi:hypothetical protein BP6252_11635 [Coleophoma cylindrospora]|uniref:Inositol polyphosphate-related phosphatase domain-containing protein n=1 Tax=Coleophoma cylindrospora TaxID=1849047 RepID=A0A3D8QK70_9HELO|nr:hypothetical protein BP6252_11635 [Coleophoma cylindrospora]